MNINFKQDSDADSRRADAREFGERTSKKNRVGSM